MQFSLAWEGPPQTVCASGGGVKAFFVLLVFPSLPMGRTMGKGPEKKALIIALN
jgi:hypothetical protein